jgi:hypothetical protein
MQRAVAGIASRTRGDPVSQAGADTFEAIDIASETGSA